MGVCQKWSWIWSVLSFPCQAWYANIHLSHQRGWTSLLWWGLEEGHQWFALGSGFVVELYLDLYYRLHSLVLFGFIMGTRIDTHGVDSSTFAITPRSFSLSSRFLYWLLEFFLVGEVQVWYPCLVWDDIPHQTLRYLQKHQNICMSSLLSLFLLPQCSRALTLSVAVSRPRVDSMVSSSMTINSAL